MADKSKLYESAGLLEGSVSDHDIETYGVEPRKRNADSGHSYKPAITLKICVLGCLVTFFVGTVLGISVSFLLLSKENWNQRSEYGGLLPTAGSVEQVWYQNLTFTEPPNVESEAAWASMMPVGRGFIHEPTIAPFISGITAFHQMHCLHAVRVAYYAAKESTPGLNETTIDLFGTRIAMGHIHHCFDYLRRGIMCAADTNLEILDPDRKTDGWGQKKFCRNWDEVWKYAEEHANNTETGILTQGMRHASKNQSEAPS